MINVNGNTYTGKSIVISNGQVLIDGKNVTPDDKDIVISVTGNIDALSVDTCDDVLVTGNVGLIKTLSGDVKVTGDVSGSVSTMSGDVICKKVAGNVSSMSGAITTE